MTAPANQTQHVPAGSPAGGQFAPGSHIPPKKGGHAAKAPLGPLTTNLTYNAKQNVGSGYNVKGGDPHVHALQQALNRLGYTDATGKALQVDGKYGPLTTQAIQAVQRAVGLQPDGIVTPQLYARIIGSPTSAAKTAAPHTPRPTKHHRGSSTLHPEATERLHEYWVHGKGAAKIAWGAPGDFDRCVVELGKYIGDPQGYCNLAHHEATGMWPAQHAALEKGHRAVSVDATVSRAAAKMPYGDVEYADPGYQSDGKKRYPIDTHDHCVAAWDYINQADNAAKYSPQHLAEVKGRIKAAGKKFGIQISDDSGRSDVPRGNYVRSLALDDVSVRSNSNGREVTAYAAVFNTPTEVADQDGHYVEELDPTIFNKAIADRAPQGGRRHWRVGVFYNHMMLPLNLKPDARFAVPIGVPIDIKADGKGLLTVTQYHRSQLADEVVEGLESGAIPGYSFQGCFLRNNPNIPRRGFAPDPRTGRLQTVRRMESTLLEYGPTPFPAYPDAAVTGIRSDSMLYALMNGGMPVEHALKLIREDTGYRPSFASQHSDPEPLPEEPRTHSARSVKEEMAAQRSRFLQRHGSR